MANIFNTAARRTITEANINYYAYPFVHPARKMAEHDFIYVLDGEWKIGQNDEVFSLKKDSLLILSAGNRHFGAAPCLAGTKTMYFHVSAESDDTLTIPHSDQTNIFDTLYDASLNRNIKRIFHDIVLAKLSGDDRRASVLFDLLLCELSVTRQQNNEQKTGERIKAIIQQNPEKFFSNKELAGFAGVSVKTAETRFKAQFGVTVHQYILNFKIEQAILYLKNFPEMQIKEIAYNLGFYDEYHFSRQFKKATGRSPLFFKQNINE